MKFLSRDIITGALWDCVKFGPSMSCGTRIRMFAEPLGTNGKTITDTNMCQSGRLYAPESFEVRRIVFTFSRQAPDAEMYEFAEHYTFRFVIGQKMYASAPLISLQTLGEPLAPIRICDFCRSVYCGDITCPGCGARQFSLSSLGADSPEGAGRRFYLDVQPLRIETQMYFYLELEAAQELTLYSQARGGRGIKLWAHLEGMHEREVQ